jgi:hypothetical protein
MNAGALTVSRALSSSNMTTPTHSTCAALKLANGTALDFTDKSASEEFHELYTAERLRRFLDHARAPAQTAITPTTSISI